MIEPLDAARLKVALDALARTDADLALALARIGYPVPRVREPGFATLLRIIVAQQLSTRAAAAIWARLEAACADGVGPERVLELSDADFRAAGFSARKVEHARALARRVLEGGLDTARLAAARDEEVVAEIASLSGFGRWSAEVYLLFALGRADVLPADDLALQVAFQRLKRLEARPTGKALRSLVLPWAPWRGAGAVFLWHYYGAATLDEGGIVSGPAAGAR
jgi:DNA-3-methyladenine glycosylase II